MCVSVKQENRARVLDICTDPFVFFSFQFHYFNAPISLRVWDAGKGYVRDVKVNDIGEGIKGHMHIGAMLYALLQRPKVQVGVRFTETPHALSSH